MNIRLNLIASGIDNGLGLIDVGTDHGYIPSVMALRGYKGNIYASDIREGPLNSARATARRLGVEDRISFILSDGLEGCPADKVDTIIIAGMGGDNITGILDRAEFCMDSRLKLLLQPMKKAEILRYWLCNNDFSIEKEEIVRDSGMLYQLLTARFGTAAPLSDAELYTGKYEMVKDNPLFPELLQVQIRRFSNIVDGLTRAGADEDSHACQLAAGILNELKEMKKW